MQENVDPSDDMAVIKRRNAALMAQINDVEDRLKSGNSGEAQPKIKTKKPKTVLRPAIGSAQIDFAIIGNRSSDEEEDEEEDEDEEVPMTEAAEDQMDSVSFDAITDCPMDWGIDNCLADYML
ncbi:uncharacterized protein LOC123716697 [Pieris brassicae]|uniref:uncharacterized protein LOC123716697 n=1 Tax=Pieris brassicae TaxID=7116 RepID=UPI001E660750|nr:uncharacterized protein LOC123716697 [Pieris brassicae]